MIHLNLLLFINLIENKSFIFFYHFLIFVLFFCLIKFEMRNKYWNLQYAFHTNIKMSIYFIWSILTFLTVYYIYYPKNILEFSFKDLKITNDLFYSQSSNKTILFEIKNDYNVIVINPSDANKLLNQQLTFHTFKPIPFLSILFSFVTYFTFFLTTIHLLCLSIISSMLEQHSFLNHPMKITLQFLCLSDILIVPFWLSLSFIFNIFKFHYANYILNLFVFWFPIFLFIFSIFFYCILAFHKTTYCINDNLNSLHEYKIIKHFTSNKINTNQFKNELNNILTTLELNRFIITLHSEDIFYHLIQYQISSLKVKYETRPSLQDYLLENLCISILDTQSLFILNETKISLKKFKKKVILIHYNFIQYELFTEFKNKRKKTVQDIIQFISDHHANLL